MTYPPNQPFPGSDPSQPGGSPYGAPPPAGGSPYGAPQGQYGPPPVVPYGAPVGGSFGPGGVAPSNNIGWAIAAIFLFWPLAIPAFIASGKVDDFWRRGDLAGAQQASADAKKWGSLGVWIGLGLYVVGCAIGCVLPTLFGVGGVCGLGLLGAGSEAGSGS